MKVFVSHARKDSLLASQLAEQLSHGGFSVWLPDEHISLGDNWAKKVGKALEDSEFMVVLLTPKALDSDSVRQDIEFALGSRKYEGRVLSVFVGPTTREGKDIPWILLKLPHCRIPSAEGFDEVVKELQSLAPTPR